MKPRLAFVAAPALAVATAVAVRDAPWPPGAAATPCPTWAARESGACLARGWILPPPDGSIAGASMQLRDLAIDGRGRGVATWTAESSGRHVVTVGDELASGAWSTHEPAAGLSGASAAPALAAGPEGAALVAWVQADAPAGVYASARGEQGAWRDPSRADALSFPPAGIEPAVAIAPSGEQIVAWCQGTSTGWGVAIAHRPSATSPWVRPASAEDVVSPPILFANLPRLATDAHGDALVAWFQSEGAPLMTYASERRGPDGAFSHPGVHDHLSPLAGPVASDPLANPKPALGPHGEAAVVWVQETGPGAAPVFLATRDAAGAWTRPRDASDAFSRPDRVARSAQLAFGAHGELFVVWVEVLGDRSAVWAARRDAEGSWVDTGRAPVQLSSEGAGGRVGAFDPVVATGPEGGVLAAWIELAGASGERVAARRTGLDRPAWEALEWLTPPAGHVRSLRAAMGPGDRALVGWVSGLAGDRIAIARVDAGTGRR
jgi:hypothetical protein